MVHVPAKFRENTSMRFWVTVRKLNVMDRRTDGRTDRWGALQYLRSRAFGTAGDNTPPQTTPTFEIQNQNKGIEDNYMDIDSNCPSLLFGETTSHLTSKWRGTFQYIFFNVENSIKREMRKNYFSKKKIHTPSPPEFFFTQIFFFNVENSMKREENMKYWKKKFLKFYFFQYLQNS